MSSGVLWQSDVPLQSLNTFGVKALARRFCRASSEAELKAAAADCRDRGEVPLILGGGSNLLIVADLEVPVIQPQLRGMSVNALNHELSEVEVAAAEPWDAVVRFACEHRLWGIENLALIPGAAGAAPVQNIGAYGLEAGEMIAEVRAWDFSTASPVRFSAEECRFGYRDSLFKQRGWHLDGRLLITSVLFRLPRRWQPRLGYADLVREFDSRGLSAPTARQVADAIIAIRRNKLPDPAVLPNAGSFFENPVLDAGFVHALRERFPALPVYPQADGRCKVAAGWLIEQAGWKGRDLGPLGMFEKQALVLVHRGGGNGNDALRLIAAVQADVESRFGIRLKPEPVRLGSEIR